MVAEVTFTNCIQSRNSSLKIVIYPKTSHSIMDGRINHHRLFPWTCGSNLLIHLEEVTISFCNSLFAKTLNSFLKIKEHCQTCLIYTISGITSLLGSTRSNVSRNQVSECRITTLKVVIPILFWNL